MIRIRKNKTTRKKLTGPGEGKPIAEKSVPTAADSRGPQRDQLRDQSRDQPGTSLKASPELIQGISSRARQGTSLKVNPEASPETSSRPV